MAQDGIDIEKALCEVRLSILGTTRVHGFCRGGQTHVLRIVTARRRCFEDIMVDRCCGRDKMLMLLFIYHGIGRCLMGLFPIVCSPCFNVYVESYLGTLTRGQMSQGKVTNRASS